MIRTKSNRVGRAPDAIRARSIAARALLVLFATSACGGPGDPQPLTSSAVATGTGPGSSGVGGSGSGEVNGAGGGASSTTTSGGASGGPSELGDPVSPHKAMHRLSNVEYDNTLSHLLGTETSFGEGFIDEEAEGFDNIATALSMSPRQVEDYFVAARTVSAEVFADSALRSLIVPCDPASDGACAQTVITTFGKRAFRRPLEQSELEGFLAKYQEALGLGVDAMGALEHVVHIMLASPQFLYRIEFDPDLADPTPHEVSGYELASRLSYALWSSMPDDELLGRAESGELLQADVLSAEVDRMLDDPRAVMLVENFAAQWFGSRRLSDHVASVTSFPTWTPELAASMQREMELYFSEFLFGARSYADFLITDINFVDANLAAHYGMAAPSGAGFEQVVETGDQRVGFLGLAGFLTHTSRETRSSPIIRGKWILDSVWCVELRLPTNVVVEPLPEPAEGETPTTLREQILAHRTDPSCAGCHDVIDPIGLALEKFDGIGRYRDSYESGLAIDTVTTMPGGAMVDGLASLSEVLSQEPQFYSCPADKFGTYAMGLSMDTTNLNQIVASWTAGEPTLRNLLKQTVRHAMFRMRKAEEL